jgi:hypothetical protein
MGPGPIFIIAGLLVPLPFVLLGGIGIYFSWRQIQKAQTQSDELKNAPLVKIKELEAGLMKIEGKVCAQDDLLRSPLSKKKCVYFRFTVEERRTHYSGRHAHSTWHTIVNDKQWIDITVADKTGEVEINLEDAEVTLTTKASTRSGTFDNASPELEELMNERYGQSTKGLIFNRDLRYSETYLRDGDEVLIVGDVKKKKGLAPKFYKGEHHLVITDMEEEQLAGAYSKRTILFWILIGFCCFFILMACGAGGVFVVIGGLATGVMMKQGDAGKVVPLEQPAVVVVVRPAEVVRARLTAGPEPIVHQPAAPHACADRRRSPVSRWAG